MSLLRRLACWWWGHEHYSLTYPDGTGQWPPCQRCGAPQMHSHRPTKPTAGRLPCQAMWRTLTTALALTLLSACGSSDDSPEALGTPIGAEVDDVATPPTAIPMPAGCTPAAPEDIQTIQAALTEPGTLTDAHTTSLDGYRYVMANVDRPDGSRLTSADIWIFDQAGNLYAGTSSAVQYTNLPDADQVPDADRYGNTDQVRALTACLTASAQQRNLG